MCKCTNTVKLFAISILQEPVRGYWAWSPTQQGSKLWHLGSHGSWAVDWLVGWCPFLALSTMGLGGGGTQPPRSPVRCHILETGPERERYFSLLSVISTQKLNLREEAHPLRRISLCFFLSHSGSSTFLPLLSSSGSQSCRLAWWEFYRVSSCMKRENRSERVGCVPQRV